MSQDNVETVQTLIEAWNNDDFAAALPLIHPKVVWRPSGAFPGMAAEYRGHDGVRSFWETLKEPFERFLIHVSRTVTHNDWVIAELAFEAIGAQSGAEVSLEFVNALQLRDGQVVRFESRATYAEALEAAGLSE